MSERAQREVAILDEREDFLVTFQDSLRVLARPSVSGAYITPSGEDFTVLQLDQKEFVTVSPYLPPGA